MLRINFNNKCKMQQVQHPLRMYVKFQFFSSNGNNKVVH